MVIMTYSKDDIEMKIEARVIIGDWRCQKAKPGALQVSSVSKVRMKF
jgi:hypothetical protein